MERRKFFTTLGAALAGAVLIKPDFSMVQLPVTSEKKAKNEKVYSGDWTGGKLFYKGEEVCVFGGVSMEQNREVFDTAPLDGEFVYKPFDFYRGRDSSTVTLSDCRGKKGLLSDLMERDRLCLLVIRVDDLVFTADVMIAETNFIIKPNTILTEYEIKVDVISPVTMEIIT